MEADDATVAAVFRAALTLGIATPADLVPLADEQVMARERPEEWIIDLSIGAAVPAGQTLDLLAPVTAGADVLAVFRLVFGLVDGVDGWTGSRMWAYRDWICHVAAASESVAAATEITNGIMAYDDDGWTIPRTRLFAAIRRFVRDHADPAALAWLPGVRVTFD